MKVHLLLLRVLLCDNLDSEVAAAAAVAYRNL
jgi:hypothetical protein